VIGVVVAVGLLGATGYYDYASWGHNQAAFAKLTEIYNQLKEAAQQKPSPGSGAVDNIAAANEQRKQLEAWIGQTRKYFQPIAPIPKPANGPVTSELFAGALHSNIVQLLHEANAANVKLPPDCDFSFKAHMERLTFAPGSLDPLSVQLGEVKTISEILFATGINALDGIQRVRVSDDDATGPQAEYLLDDQPVTNDLAVLAPYQVTFRGFSPEIARVLGAFAASPHGFIIKTISVQPDGASALTATTAPTAADRVFRSGFNPNVAPPAPAPQPGKGGLQTVLNEQLLSVTMKIEVVKLAPRN
jgi:hypothetical protein